MKDTALAKLLADLQSFSNLAPDQAKALLLASTYKLGVDTPSPTGKTLPEGITRITRDPRVVRDGTITRKDLNRLQNALRQIRDKE